MTLVPGARLGPYEILAQIGEGGMGAVYKARDTRLDRFVAIKVSQEQFSERFGREARAIAALNHPHICTLHDVGPDYLVMEFVDGKPLKGPLPIDQVLRYGVQIADALDAAHRMGITHRDLKPANILLTRAGVKLLDFGLAKLAVSPAAGADADATLKAGLSQAGIIMGTPQYMSPEQVEGQNADARSDLFSFGVLLYELITGKLAFAGKTVASVMAAVLRENPPPVTTLVPVTPPALDRIVSRCLQKDPDNRFQTARDLKHALMDLPAPAPALPAVPLVSSRKWMYLSAAAGCAVIALAVLALRKPASVLPPHQYSILAPAGTHFDFDNLGGSAISPDGRVFAFVADRNLWLRFFESGVLKKIAGTSGATFPFWSPDSKAVAFFTSNNKLTRLDLAAETLKEIADAPAGRGGAWNSSGNMIVAFQGSRGRGLLRVSESGGAPQPITTLNDAQKESSHYWPAFLPDGDHFVYVIRSADPAYSGIYLGSLKIPSLKSRISPAVSSTAIVAASSGFPTYLLYARDGWLMAQALSGSGWTPSGDPVRVASPVGANANIMLANFSASRTGSIVFGRQGARKVRVTWVDRQGRKLGASGDADEFSGIALSPDGARVALRRNNPSGNSSLWLLDLSRGVLSPLAEAGMSPVWNGQEIAFVDFNLRAVVRKRYDSSGSGEVLAAGVASGDLDWSRDGAFVYRNGSVVSLNRPKEEVRVGGRDQRQCRFSPDSKWIACTIGMPGGNQVVVQSFPENRTRYQVSTAGGERPLWRADGKELYYLSLEGRNLMAVAVKPASGGLTFEAPRTLFPINTISYYYDVSQDGQKFVTLVPENIERDAAEMAILTNWREGLKRPPVE